MPTLKPIGSIQQEAFEDVAEREFEREEAFPVDARGIQFLPEIDGLDYARTSLDLYEQNLSRPKEGGASGLKQTAMDVAYKIREKNPDLFPKNADPYEYMRSADVPWLKFQDQEVKPLRDQDIVANFLRNPDNKAMGPKSFLTTFLTEGLPSGVGAAAGTVVGAKAGFKAGMALTASLPPFSPWTLATRVAVPVVGAIGGAILGEESADALSRKFIFGEDELFLPTRKARAKQKSAETLAYGVGFAPVPRVTATTLDFGTKALFKNLQDRRNELFAERTRKIEPLQKDGKPISAEAAAQIDEITEEGLKMAEELRDPRTAKFVRGVENLVTRFGRRGREMPVIPFTQTRVPVRGLMPGLEEVAFGAGAAGGRYLSESGTDDPSGIANLTSEFLGGFGGLSAFSTTVGIPSFLSEKAPGFLKFVTRKLKNAVGQGEEAVLTEGDKISAINFIEKQLEAREDLTPDQIRELGELLQTLPMTTDGKNIAALLEEQQEEGVLTFKQLLSEVGRLSPEFQDKLDEAMLKVVSEQGRVILEAYEYGDMELLRYLLTDVAKNIELLNNSQLMEIAGEAINKFNQALGRDADPEDLSRVLRARIKNAYDYSRNRAERLYDEVPNFNVEQFWEPNLDADGEPVLRELPNFFDILDNPRLPRLPSQIGQIKGDVRPIISFLVDILRESGIDTSRLNKIDDGTSVGEGAVNAFEAAIARLQSQADRLMRGITPEQRAIFDGAGYRSNDPEFQSLSLADQEDVLINERNVTDEAISNARRIRAGEVDRFVTGQPENIGNLEYVRRIILNRLNLVAERRNLEAARLPENQPTGRLPDEEQQLTNSIINLRALRDELQQSGFPVTVNFEDLRKARSLALSAKRNAESGTRNDTAVALNGDFARLVQNDIDGSLNSRDLPPFVAGSLGLAQAYYAAFKQTFNNLTGQKLKSMRDGVEMTMPDSQVIDKLFSTNDSAQLYETALAIQNMASFVPTPDLPTSMLPADSEAYKIADDLRSALSKAVLYGRAQALKPAFRSGVSVTEEGRAVPASALEFEQFESMDLRSLQALLNDVQFKKMLSLFPDFVENDLRIPISAEAVFKTEQNRINDLAQEAKDNLLLKHMLEDVGLGDATADVFVANVFNSGNPVRELRQAFKLFDRAVEDFGMDATRVALTKNTLFRNIMRYAVRQGTNSQGMIDADKINRFISGPIQGRQGTEAGVSLKDLMREYDLFDELEELRLNEILDKARIAQNQTIKSYQELPKSERNRLLELVASVAGSRLAININDLLGGPAGAESIIIAGRGAALGRALISAESQVLNMEGLIYVLQHPKELGAYLAKNKMERGGVEGFWANVRNFLISKGFAIPRRTLTGTEQAREDLREAGASLFEVEEDDEGIRRGFLNIPLPPETMTGVTHLVPVDSMAQPDPDPAPAPAPAPVRTPVPTRQPTARTTPLNTRREFEAMERQSGDPQQPDAPKIDEQTGAPLSIRNNNPGNLRMVGQPGAQEGEQGFAAFATPGQGLNALTRQVLLDTQERGLTLAEFITKYAPPSENDTERYISFIERKTNIPRNRKIPEFMIPDVVRAIVEMEGGQLALRYFFGDRMRAEAPTPAPEPAEPAEPPIAQATPPSPGPVSAQSLQRAAQVLGPQDEIGALASEMLMRQRPA